MNGKKFIAILLVVLMVVVFSQNSYALNGTTAAHYDTIGFQWGRGTYPQAFATKGLNSTADFNTSYAAGDSGAAAGDSSSHFISIMSGVTFTGSLDSIMVALPRGFRIGKPDTINTGIDSISSFAGVNFPKTLLRAVSKQNAGGAGVKDTFCLRLDTTMGGVGNERPTGAFRARLKLSGIYNDTTLFKQGMTRDTNNTITKIGNFRGYLDTIFIKGVNLDRSSGAVTDNYLIDTIFVSISAGTKNKLVFFRGTETLATTDTVGTAIENASSGNKWGANGTFYVGVTDVWGNLVESDSATSVTLQVWGASGQNPPSGLGRIRQVPYGGTYTLATQVSATNSTGYLGRYFARIPDIGYTRHGTGIYLQASSSGLTLGTTSQITLVPTLPQTISFVSTETPPHTSPDTMAVGSTKQFKVTVTDSFSNAMASDTITVRNILGGTMFSAAPYYWYSDGGFASQTTANANPDSAKLSAAGEFVFSYTTTGAVGTDTLVVRPFNNLRGGVITSLETRYIIRVIERPGSAQIDQPSLSSPANSSIGISTSPILIWNKVTDATSYTLQVSQSSNFSSFVFNQAIADTSKQISGLSEGITYYWRVNALNSDTTSEWSSTWSFTTVVSLKWSYPTGGYIHSSPAIGSDGTIYVGTTDHKLYAVTHTGSLKWSYTTGGQVRSSPAIDSDGTVYVGVDDSKLYALNPTGTLKWSYTTENYIDSSPAIGSDGTIYVGAANKNLYALTPTGALKWSYPTGGYIHSSPAIGSDGTIYVGSEDNKLYALSPAGSLKWSYTTGGQVRSSPAIDSDGTIYVGSQDSKLYALNPEGTLKWSYTTGKGIYSSPAIGVDGTIYVGSDDGKLYAVTPKGTLKWSYSPGNVEFYSSPAIGSDGTIYVGSFNSELYALTPTGTVKWSYTTGGSVDSSPAIGSDGTIYIGSGKLYALTSSSTVGLASSPWPMFHHDNQHTGNYTPLPAPLPPVLSSPINGGTGISTSPTLIWNKASGATSYTLQVSQTSNFSSFVFNQAVTDTSKQISGLTNSVMYYWRVNAFNPDRSSGWSYTWNFTTKDGTPPAISDLNAGNAVMGQEKIITCNVTDNVLVKSVKLYYRSGGSTLFTSIDMIKQTGSSYAGTIPSSAVTTKGIEYYVEAIDNADNKKSYPEINPKISPQVIQITIGGSGITRLGENLSNIPEGKTNNDFRMLSIPLDLDNKNPLTVLGTDLGSTTYDQTKWRIFRYSGNSYAEYPSIPEVQPGYAFWLIVKNANPTINARNGKTVPTSGNFTLTIPSGWSQIGNPFNFPVSWNTIKDSTGSSNADPVIHKWTGSSFITNVTVLLPWEGYFIYNKTSGNITLKIPPKEYTGTPKVGDFLASINPDGWTVQIKAQTGDRKDTDNFIGVSPDASEGYDNLDFAEPPPFSDYVSLYFPHKDSSGQSRCFAGDFRTPENEGITWDFVVESSLKEKVDLQFENVDSVPEDMKINLIDMKSITITDLRTEDKYSFQPFIGGKKTDTTTSKFKLVIGNDSYIKQVMQDLPKLPEEYLLEQNYPNPFNPITTIRFALPKEGRVSITIYNILGQEVKTVISEQLPAGIHEVQWDGTNNFGQPVASGMYLYCMRAGNKYVQTKKLLLVK